jgi:hypothetical protein
VQTWNFDGTTVNLALVSTGQYTKWQPWNPADTSKSGKGVLYYGGLPWKNYTNGNVNPTNGTATFGLPNLEASGKHFLTASLYLAIEPEVNFDTLKVVASAAGKPGLLLWQKAAPFLPQGKPSNGGPTVVLPKGWFDINVEIPASLGTSNISIQFVFDTVDGQGNGGLGVLVDDVQVVRVCN